MNRRPFHRASEAERREDLIRATLDCIAETGLQGATVRQIAARAGVTGGLIRHYFTSKNQMVEAAYIETIASMNGAVIAAADPATGDARTRLRKFIVANVSPPVTDPRTLSLWAAFISHVRVDPGFADIHRQNYLSFLKALEDLIEEVLNDSGRPTPRAECHEYAIAINGLIDGLWLEGTLAGDLFDDTALPKIALRSVEALLGGISLGKDNNES
ncbi:TetR family transcriptional regulator C-terminal domain-containing protein [Agrobacterium sp. ES01]|uniref:TetR family transcriptional regulator C-terminal domain-containing protein n=1 Tax=Agrobacterium sp. ES01 TaxID=3420714 RepID=UPI003D10ECE9